jgi:hypothetical protein
MADRAVRREPEDPHIPLTPEFFERVTHQDPPPEHETLAEMPWYVRFAAAWAGWRRHKADGERH